MPLPTVLSLDCEFKPLRCAIVDGAGRVCLDCLVTQRVAGSSERPLSGILRCDAPRLQKIEVNELRALLLRLVEGGTILVAHTPQSDLRALSLLLSDGSMPPELLGRVIDVAQLGKPTPDAPTMSLKRMAAEHLNIQIQHGTTGGGSAGSRRHCAIEDARVTMQLYQQLSGQ